MDIKFEREKMGKKTPTFCLATVCKNEESCIQRLLESVCEFIDYWVIVDTGSTDRTCEIIQKFFDEKGIPGELHHDEWVSMGHNKTRMMAYAKDKSDYLIHIDSDDYMVGKLDPGDFTSDHHVFLWRASRGKGTYKAFVGFDNRLTWKFSGVAHTIIRCVETPGFKTLDLYDRSYHVVSVEEGGARSFDPDKYYKDALKLQKQFFDSLLDDSEELLNRSIFYTAQSYLDCGKTEEALKWYRLYTKVTGGWIEEYFESEMRIARCMMILGWDLEKITDQMEKAIQMFPDRSEPLYILGKYCNDVGRCDLGYQYLKKAKSKSFLDIKDKYFLFFRPNMYGIYLNDELSISCYWTGRYQEGYEYLMEIVDNEEFSEHQERLLQNKKHFQDAMQASPNGTINQMDFDSELCSIFSI